MDEYARHRNVVRLLYKHLASPIKKFFHFSTDDLSSLPEPFLLLSNHNTDLDPVFVSVAAGHQVYFVASEHIMRRPLIYKFLSYHVKPIIHQKGRAGLKSSIEMLRHLKEGRCVCLFPEGNRSFNGRTCEIPFGTAKLAKKSGVPLVTYKFEGGYLSQPRWGKGFRKGKLLGKLVHVYSPEELKAMTDDQVDAAICTDLYEDAYETNKALSIPYRGKKPAEGLESTIFACPSCGGFSTLSTKGNKITCGQCHYTAEYDDYGRLTDAEGFVSTVTDWDTKQMARLSEVYARIQPEVPLFNDAVKVLTIENHKVVKRSGGLLTAFKDRFSYETLFALPEDIEGAAIYSRNVLVVHLATGKQIEIRGSKRFNAYKYLQLYKLMQQN